MEAIELLAILILAGAIVVLIYYYIQNNSEALTKVKTYIPNITPDGNTSEISLGENKMGDTQENVSVGDKLKVRFKDIDMPSLNTDSFSKKIDAFLDGKSDELIQDWSLATKNDIEDLEKRCDVAYNNIDDLEKRFIEFKNYTNEKIDSLDERLKKLEEEDLN